MSITKYANFGKSLLFLILTVVSFGSGLILAFTNKPEAAIATFGCFAFCSVLFLLAQFKKFKAFGVEAELWDEKQTEAERLVNELKSSLASLSSTTLDLSIKSGRWDSAIPRRTIVQNLEENSQILRDAGKSGTQIRTSQARFYETVCIDLSVPILTDFNKKVDEKLINCVNLARSKHPAIIIDTVQYMADTDSCRLLGKESLDWNKLIEEINVFEIFDRTLERINRKSILADADRNELLEKHKTAIDEINHIKEFGKFKNADVWVRKDTRQ